MLDPEPNNRNNSLPGVGEGVPAGGGGDGQPLPAVCQPFRQVLSPGAVCFHLYL
jgi:hypothetical protein